MAGLETKYKKDMDVLCPHSYHPRPSFRRDKYLSLGGEWDFCVGKDGESPIYNEKITVPFPPESPLSGIFRQIARDETMYYKRSVTLPPEMRKDRIILHLGAVDETCEIRISGKPVGAHCGGYLPFSFDITPYLAGEGFTVEVIAKDTLGRKYPYGKQTDKRGGMWYTPVSGIWQSVWLEARPVENAVESLKITPISDGVIIEIEGGAPKKRIILEDSGQSVDFTGAECVIRPENLVKWSPECPKLYYFTLESGEDVIHSYFAVREIGIAEIDGYPRLTLNGEPYVFNGLLDQGYYPDGLFLPPTADCYLDDIRLAKALGFNMLRKHIKIEPDIFYYLCDREGIAVFQDMVNNGVYSFIRDTALPTLGLQKRKDKRLHRDKETRRIFEETMLGTADLLYNHPSVVYYTIFNEGWGQFSSDKMYKKLREKDGTRIIDSTSGWFRGHESDVDSRHVYFKRLKAGKRESKPLVISEFGGYSYRVEGHLFSEKNYGYRLFSEREKFEEAFFDLYRNEVAPLVKEGASAFVYTQLSDVEDETNGLVSYDREIVKVDKEKCKLIMKEIFSNK